MKLKSSLGHELWQYLKVESITKFFFFKPLLYWLTGGGINFFAINLHFCN